MHVPAKHVSHDGPDVSVVIPTYNRMVWLPTAVSSVLGQTCRDFELIVVDDGSTDGTAAWLADIGDPRVLSIRLPHSGNVAQVRNAGAAHARGRFLCFLDSDDVWLPTKLERQTAAVAQRPGTWSYTRYEHIDERGRPIPPRAGEWRAVSGSIAVPLISMQAAVSIVTVLVPRHLFDELGGFDERPRIREDYEFLVRLAARAEAVSLSECLVQVRDHPSRSTRALRGAEPYLRGAETCAVLLESLTDDAARRSARQRWTRYVTEAGTAHLRAGALGPALECFLRAVRSGVVPQVARTGRRGAGVARRRLRGLVRPLLGRESATWRWLPWPRLRRLCFGDPIDCIIHALLASKRHVRFVQIGSNDGVTNDPLWTFRRYRNWSGVLVEPLESAFARLSRNYASWKDRLVVVRAAVASQSGTAQFYHFAEPADSRTDHDQFGSLDPDHLRRHAHRFGPGRLEIVATEVRCLTFHDLLATQGFRSLDLLHIDAEGSDEMILRQVDLVGSAPAVILYEHINLRPEARASLHAELADAGYESVEVGADTLAVSGQALAALPPLRSAWRLVSTAEATLESPQAALQ